MFLIRTGYAYTVRDYLHSRLYYIGKGYTFPELDLVEKNTIKITQ